MLAFSRRSSIVVSVKLRFTLFSTRVRLIEFHWRRFLFRQYVVFSWVNEPVMLPDCKPNNLEHLSKTKRSRV